MSHVTWGRHSSSTVTRQAVAGTHHSEWVSCKVPNSRRQAADQHEDTDDGRAPDAIGQPANLGPDVKIQVALAYGMDVKVWVKPQAWKSQHGSSPGHE